MQLDTCHEEKLAICSLCQSGANLRNESRSPERAYIGCVREGAREWSATIRPSASILALSLLAAGLCHASGTLEQPYC
jgi:hypothetical protein